MTASDGPGFAARSDIGLQRTGNEDGFLARPPVFAVADGMGGHQAGEVAAGLAIESLAEIAGRDTAPSTDEVVESIEGANGAIRREARARADLSGMGTTCTAVVVAETVVVAHVGDSRAYLFRDDRLVQVTDDHSLVASMVREGLIDPVAAQTDARRNIITRALGADDDVHVDVVTLDRMAGDRLVVCTDGLHGQVDDAAIAEVLRDERDPGEAADRLVAIANEAGGDDNVTVIVIDPDALILAAPIAASDAPATADPAPPRRGRRRTVVALLLVALIVATIAAAAAWIWMRSAVGV